MLPTFQPLSDASALGAIVLALPGAASEARPADTAECRIALVGAPVEGWTRAVRELERSSWVPADCAVITIEARGNDDPFLAVIPRGPEEAPDDPPFWVQSWRPDYRELDAAHDLTSADELDQVAYQVGLQLGRGHIRQFATPFDHQLRRAVRDMLRDYGPRIRATIDNMTERTLASWQHFRDEAARDAP